LLSETISCAAERKAAVRSRRSENWRAYDQVADFPVIHFSGFADAAFVRKRGTFFAVLQRVSLDRSFKGLDFASTKTELSPQAPSI